VPGVLTANDGELLADVASRALSAVVSVSSTRAAESTRMELPDLGNDPFWRFFAPPDFGSPGNPLVPPGEAPLQHGLGSGVLVGRDVILTNAHVVEGARELVVKASDQRILQVKLAGSDPKSDLAVLRVTSDTNGLTPIEFADSSRARLGQIVLAIGYPFGLGGTVTMGIVSAKGRANLGIVDYEDFLQTDAAVNPGNSGGALIDLDARLLGVPTAILSRSGGSMGVGFAIPSNMAKPIMTSLLERGRVERGFLGVTIQDLDPDLARALGVELQTGVLISDVTSGSPAERAGVRRGDVVVTVDGRPVQSSGEFRNLIAAAGSKEIELEVLRGGRRERLRATLIIAPNDESSSSSATQASPRASGSGPAGMFLAPLDPSLRTRLQVPPSIKSGVVVSRVQPGTPASEAGLRPGDVIIEVNRQPVTNAEGLAQAWERNDQPLALLVWREGHTFYAVIKR
jgi:serine protease Do